MSDEIKGSINGLKTLIKVISSMYVRITLFELLELYVPYRHTTYEFSGFHTYSEIYFNKKKKGDSVRSTII